jgi:hypothetical protein
MNTVVTKSHAVARQVSGGSVLASLEARDQRRHRIGEIEFAVAVGARAREAEKRGCGDE